MKVKELKAELKKLGLSTKGKKAELEARLVEATAEDDIVEEVVEEEIVEEEEELVEKPAEEEKEDEVIDLGKGAFLVNGAYTVPKRPDTPLKRWVKEVYGKKPDGGFVDIYTGDHYDGKGNKLEPKE
tara:strand:+ start:432 stop:812 length:381 start_codon:yes stop_codon:yes gene_type:complete